MQATSGGADNFLKTSYWTSLARERGRLKQDYEIATDITVTKHANTSTVTAGKPDVQYEITITNNTIKEEEITLKDSAKDDGDINKSDILIGTSYVKEFPDTYTLGSNETVTIKYTGKPVDKNGDGKVINEVVIQVGGVDVAKDTATVYVVKSDLDIKIYPSKTTVSSGTEVTFKIEVTNKAQIEDYVRIIANFDPNQIRVTDYENGERGRNDGEKIVWGENVTKKVKVNSGGSVDLSFTGKVLGNTGDSIKCTAKITESSIAGSTFSEKDDTAEVKIVNSDLTVKKTVDKEKVAYGGKVTYTINIENKASIDDTIDITDTFDTNKIKNISNLQVDGRRTTSTGTSNGFTISGIGISAKKNVTITYDANIYGNIGEKIKNKVTVESKNSGKKEAEAEITTTIEKRVKMEIAGVVKNRRVLLAIDTSNSMLDIGGYKKICNNFINQISLNSIAVGVITYDWNVQVYSSEAFLNKKLLGTGDSTNYNGALQEACSRRNEFDVLVFLSDGLPTFRFWWNPTGWIKTGFDRFGSQMPWRGSATDSLGRTYNGILDYADIIKGAGKQIYTVGYSVNEEGQRGLEQIASPGGYFDVPNIEILFEELSTVLFANLDLEESYETENGVIKELKYVDRISKIEIGSTVYEGDSLTNFLNTHLKNRATVTSGRETYQTGNLDLTGISGKNDITITFQ